MDRTVDYSHDSTKPARPGMSITRRVALLSVGAAVATLVLKFGAYVITGSVGLLSDAAESLVNLSAALMAFIALTVAGRPPDDTHAYGHDKVEYFSSGAEGTLIIIAAGTIIFAAVQRLLNPQELTNLGLGSAIALVASGINFVVSRIMLRVARQHDSIALEADAHHLMTDVWTSIGVVAGVGIVWLTGWTWLDPVIAILVAINIVVVGISLLRRSTAGLMDATLPPEEVATIQEAITAVVGDGIPYHGLRTRKSGPRRFVDFHLLLPGGTSVQEAHDLVQRIDDEIQGRLPNIYITTHVEPWEDSASWDQERVGGLTSSKHDDIREELVQADDTARVVPPAS